ncbi:cell surface protein [methanogenic archaeon mixed culture ISO4-G1]|nr:cell surface protein [methanogenic archaeon mixed culture ISO4-G1]
MDGIIRASAIAMALLMVMSASVILLTDGSDAYTSSYNLEYEAGQEVDQNLTDITGKGLMLEYSGSLPDGLRIDIVTVSSNWLYSEYNTYLRGTLIAQTGSYTFKLTDDSNFYEFRVSVFAGECTVTYDAGIGLVNGQQTWSETITKGTFASLPKATHSSGAYTFMGWSESATAAEGVASYNAIKDVILHAVWKRNTVQVSDATATITNGQSAVLPITTNPGDSQLSISSAGGLPEENIKIEGYDLLLDMTGVEPGTYFIQLNASYTGYITGESIITVRVPITIVKPIEYVLTQGDSFSYTPVTNPTNANITLVSVMKDSNIVSEHGIEVQNRSIVGSFDAVGTYAIIYTASLEGYVDVTSTVFVKVNERPATAPAPVMGTITATPRANEPRVYDFVISGYANASNIIWSYEGQAFATSSPTALFEFPASGSYTVKCTLAGFDGSFVSEEFSVICLDNYHREAAWSGVQYSCIIESDDEVSIENGAPFSVVTEEVNGHIYRMISGTPSDAYVGESYHVFIGDDSWTIQIYPGQTSAPVADFDLVLSDDGYTVVAVFKGQNASFYTYDFDGDGIPEPGNAYTYGSEGRYTVVCKAVNNVSETSKSDMVSINVIPHEDVSVIDLTDFQMVVGERLDIVLSLKQGDDVSISGTAADFVTLSNGILRAEPTQKGEYELTVSVAHAGQSTVSKTVKVTVRGTEVQDLEEEKHDYMVVMAVFFMIAVIAIAAFILRDIRQPDFGQRSSLITRILRRRQYR